MYGSTYYGWVRENARAPWVDKVYGYSSHPLCAEAICREALNTWLAKNPSPNASCIILPYGEHPCVLPPESEWREAAP